MIRSFIRCLCKALAGVASLLAPLSAFAGSPPGLFDNDHAAVRAVIAVQSEVTPDLMQQPEILGTAVGIDASGALALTVYVDRDAPNAGEVIRSLPREFRGVGVQIHLTDKFRAMRGKPVRGVSHTAKQTPPIQLGTSGGWSKDLANGYCCGGTLGSLVSISGVQYILSNYHVFESDIVSGGNNTTAQTGDNIIQPGLIDVNCNVAGAQNVAKLVKKSGRTTGLSHSKISGLNASVSVAYDNECAGGAAFTKTYTGQILVGNSGSSFLNSGDSGSLMVEDIATAPRAVGLLFAGSSTSAIANPIGQVLTFLGATMD